jgi:hypothetical protein
VSAFGVHWLELSRCLLLTQSGHWPLAIAVPHNTALSPVC